MLYFKHLKRRQNQKSLSQATLHIYDKPNDLHKYLSMLVVQQQRSHPKGSVGLLHISRRSFNNQTYQRLMRQVRILNQKGILNYQVTHRYVSVTLKTLY